MNVNVRKYHAPVQNDLPEHDFIYLLVFAGMMGLIACDWHGEQ